MAQQNKLDSLQNLYSKTDDDQQQVKYLSEMFGLLEQNDPNGALSVAKKSMIIAENGSGDDLTYCYNQLGIAYSNLNLRDSALFYYQKTLKNAEQELDSAYIAKANNNIGSLYADLGNYDLALDYFDKCAEIEKRMKDYSGASSTYNNIGGMNVYLGNLEKATETLLMALKFGELSGNLQDLSTTYHNLSYIYSLTGEYQLAKEYCFKEIKICEELKLYFNAAQAYASLANTYFDEGNYQEAVQYGKKALELSEKVHDAEYIMQSYRILSKGNAGLGFYKDAYDNSMKFADWQDSLYQMSNQSTIIEMEKKYKTEQAEKENQILQQENAISQLENEKSKKELTNSRIIIWSSVGGLLLLLGLAFTLYNRNKLKQKANEELQIANEIINEKNQDITASLEYASKIQQALLPSKSTPIFSDAMFMLKPKDIVSGDFFWYTEKNGKKIFTAVDCTGHGVPGAFMSMIGNTFLHEIVNEKGITQPDEILNELKAKVIDALSKRDERKDGADMAICAIDMKTMTVEFAGANNPLYIVQNNEIREIKGDKQPVGLMIQKDGPFTNHRININKGDSLYVFSDGFADQFGGPKGKKFKYKQLRDLLFSISDKTMAEQKQILKTTFDNWKGDLEQVDDVCVIGVRV